MPPQGARREIPRVPMAQKAPPAAKKVTHRRICKKTSPEEAKKQAADQRSAKYGHHSRPSGEQLHSELSLPEQIVFLDSTARDYTARRRPLDPRVLLIAMLDFLDCMFLDGCSHSDGSKLLASVEHLVPTVKEGAYMIQRVKRALRGWDKRAPAASRLPPPVWLVMAFIGDLIYLGCWIRALCVLTHSLTYLRPGELIDLDFGQLIAPHESFPGSTLWVILLHPVGGVGSKVGEHDESLILDTPGYEFIGNHLQRLKDRRPILLWEWNLAEYNAALDNFSKAAKVEAFNLVPYSMRHAGASHDVLAKVRSIAEVKLRGRWRSDSSLQRYSKPAQSQQMAHELAPEVAAFGKLTQESLDKWLSGAVPPARPPWRPAA